MSNETIEELRERVEQLEEQQAELKQGAVDAQGRAWNVSDFLNMGLTRRQALQAIGVLAGGATLGTAIQQAVGVASAAPSTTDGDGDVGTPENPVDVFADGVSAGNYAIGSEQLTTSKSFPQVDNGETLVIVLQLSSSVIRKPFSILFDVSSNNSGSAKSNALLGWAHGMLEGTDLAAGSLVSEVIVGSDITSSDVSLAPISGDRVELRITNTGPIMDEGNRVTVHAQSRNSVSLVDVNVQS